MAQNAIQDENQFPALIAHSGTAGTATPIRVTATDGAINVAGTFSSTAATATNTYGSVSTVVNDTTGTVVNIGSVGSGFKLKGFYATGSGQGYYSLLVNGTPRLFYRTNIADKVADVILPNPDSLSAGDQVLLKVVNENGDTQDFEGIILGE